MSPGNERRPGEGTEAAGRSFGGDTHRISPEGVTPVCCLDVSHAAFVAGFDLGYARGRQHASEDLADALLHEQALVMQGLAVKGARERYGDSWSEAIREQAEAVD